MSEWLTLTLRVRLRIVSCDPAGKPSRTRAVEQMKNLHGDDRVCLFWSCWASVLNWDSYILRKNILVAALKIDDVTLAFTS